jgi:hypothetical protein
MKYFVKEGERYSRLVVIATQIRLKGKLPLYNLCQCDCGKKAYRTSRQLVLGLLKSCGCGRRERLRRGNLIHGGTVPGKNETGFAYLYGFWLRTRSRCHNPKDTRYPQWGKRGIALYPEWREDYPAFRDYVEKTLGTRPSLGYRLGRWDEKKDFEPGNLLWTTERTPRKGFNFTFS